MNDSIDLESVIMAAWQTSEDLHLLFHHYGDHPVPMTEDEVSNALWGIKVLHDMRMENLMDTYCRKFELNQYCTDPERLARREDFFDTFKTEAFATKKKGSKK